jgi:uroporphyrinogen-III decarboxylase
MTSDMRTNAIEKPWSELTPKQKRESRTKSWLSPTDINFKNNKAERLYKERTTRLWRALNLKEPDRVPVQLPSEAFPAYYIGADLRTVMYNYKELRRAWMKFIHDFDMDTFRGPGLIHPARAFEIMDHRLYKWPGHGLSPDVSLYQYVEGEYMKPDEYDAFLADPSDFALRVYMPRIMGALGGLQYLSPLTSAFTMNTTFITPFARPDVRRSYAAMIKAGEEIERWQKYVGDCSRAALEAGVPSTRGGMALAPFDILGDSMRGTQQIFIDVFRRPEKVLKALDVIADFTIRNAIEQTNAMDGFLVSFPLHKGDDTFISQEQFDSFYWPSLKKVILALIKEGIMVSLFAEGRYTKRLERISELPKGWAEWHFDQTDMTKAKEVLGGKACIAGNIPASLMCTGNPAQIKEYCRNLIETCGKGGGYILTGGAAVTETTAANLNAITDAAKEYGVYK